MHWAFEQGNVGSPRLAEYSASLEDDVQRYAQIFDERTQKAKRPLTVRPYLSGSHKIISGTDAVPAGIAHDVAEATLPADSIQWWVNNAG